MERTGTLRSQTGVKRDRSSRIYKTDRKQRMRAERFGNADFRAQFERFADYDSG
jgi:hypothetical protein